MSDVFGRKVEHTGTVRPEDIFMSDLAGLGSGLVTGINLEYTQQVSRVWSLLAGDMWLVAGETNGTCTVDSLLGGGGIGTGDVCNPGSVSITAGEPCMGGGEGRAANYTMDDCFEQGVSLKGQAGGGLQITEGVTLGFCSLHN